MKMLLSVIVALLLVGCEYTNTPPVFCSKIKQEESSEFIGKICINDNVSIRLLVLKHCPDEIANTDSMQAIEAINFVKSKGLYIEDIGNYHIDPKGKTEKVSFNQIDLSGLKQFISDQMKINATPGDTLVIYTIGHGSSSGSLMRLGQRTGLIKIIAEAAEENDQKTFWWQLSCYAASGLSPIESLTEKQQELFAMSASSPANESSYFCTQGEQLKAVFSAMAEKSVEIDPNQDGIITAGELKNFMIKKFGEKRGSLIFACNSEEPLFGLTGRLANSIPIVDRNNTQGKYPKNYILTPKR